MRIAVIKYNAGNIRSVHIALEHLGIDPIITDNPTEILQADKVIFPGVGEASSAMKYLKERKLDTLITSLKQPVLGICLGLQLMCNFSEEANTSCMQIFDTQVKLFPPEQKVPHMGWNTITELKGLLFKNISDGAYVYFVHSFAAELCNAQIAVTNYIYPFAAALQKNNFFALQFHPEKSGQIGEQILKNFIDLKG
ncbi:MAG: imidazole glycerol phosphate synthase subunit HisH [Candidatus Marinimicrobia bacterium]|nr:imidazole glycerol phosphate synthase subunit HisH [Candidatus Neomarinimicrobiota bacterium]